MVTWREKYKTIEEREKADYHAVHIHFQSQPVFPQTPFPQSSECQFYIPLLI